MKQPKPLPTEQPFLTLYTVTRHRPIALHENFRSVEEQTAVARVEQLVFPDHLGLGLAGALFGRVPWYAGACRGRYVAFLGDDDRLAEPRVVEHLERFVVREGDPPVVLVTVKKGDQVFPKGAYPTGEPVEGDIDLGSYVLRRDVWLTYKDAYGLRYQGDYDLARRMWQDGLRAVYAQSVGMFAVGPMSNGRPEF